MPLILHIDTATDICSVCLARNGDLLGTKENKERNTHAAVITQLIEELIQQNGLKRSDLNAVAISSGPGSYTGLRIGTSIAKGLCYVLNIPLIAVPTLKVIAAGGVALDNSFQYYCSMLDARRNEVYAALYDKNMQEVKSVTSLIIDKPENLFQFAGEQGTVFLGNGADKFEKMFKEHKINYLSMYEHTSIYMAGVAFKYYRDKKFENIAYFEPLYLKLFDKIINK